MDKDRISKKTILKWLIQMSIKVHSQQDKSQTLLIEKDKHYLQGLLQGIMQPQFTEMRKHPL